MSKMAELVKPLVEKYGLGAKEAEHFVAMMFDVVASGVREEGLVKVKGLGTFKMASVNARESIDVNTGERITIDGRDKITFTPEASMRDRVNAPFSQFETVVVNEGVDFAAIDQKYQADLPHEEEQAPPSLGEGQEVASSTEEEQEPMEAPAGIAPLVEIPQPVAEESLPATEEPQPAEGQAQPVVEEQPAKELPQPAMEEEPADAEDDNAAPLLVLNQQQMQILHHGRQTEEEQEESDVDSGLLAQQVAKNSRMIRWLFGLLAALAVLACVGAYYLGRQMALRDNRIQYLESTRQQPARPVAKPRPAPPQPAAPPAAKPDTAVKQAPAPQQAQPAVEKERQATAAPAKEEKPTAEKKPVEKKPTEKAPAEKKPAVPKASAYDSDVRIRTGAYRIEGVATTVTVRKGQTLQSISRSHLGPDMECYVEAINGKKEVKEGDQVKIPKLALKKKAAK